MLQPIIPLARAASPRIGWRAWLVGLVAAALLLTATARPAAAEPAAIQLMQAEFQTLDLDGKAGPLQRVDLPDTWAQRGLAVQGSARYRLHFKLNELPTQPWALSLTRVSATRRVMLNDSLVAVEGPVGRQHPVPNVIELPLQLLRIGDNQIDLQLQYRSRGGLSPAALGPSALLRTQAHRTEVLERELPRALNTGMAMIAALMLLIRWRRPSENAIALFGVLALIGSLRNYAYFGDVTLLHSAVSDWLFYCLQVWTASLFVAFARSVGEPVARPWVGRLLLGVALVLPLAAAALVPWGLLPQLRTVTYPLLLALGATAVYLIWQGRRRHGAVSNGTLAAAFAAVLAAGAHDYAYQQGHLDLTGNFWMPYVMPLSLGLYALALLGRFVRALAEVEALRDTLEAQVAHRTRALESAVAVNTRFLAAASHDLRQPAVAIGLMIGLVREHPLAPEVRHMIDRAHEAVGALEDLLQGLLDLSRLDSGTVQARPVPVPLQRAFDAIQSHEADAAAAKGLQLRFRAQSRVVLCDPMLLDQLLRNLVANALRYTHRGGVLVVARARGPNQVLIQVWDSGIGIAAQDQAEIFEEFVQLANPGRNSARGLGLGLALVKRCAALLGTSVQLQSWPGRGSCFSLALPRLERRARARSPRLATTPAVPLSGQHVLLVDDDVAVREALTARLQAWGATVTAFDGLQAVCDWLATDHPKPDLLLSDQLLTAGSGLQVLEAVRERHGPVPALLVTGNTAPAEIARLAATGLAVLHKPFRAEALLAAIAKVMAP